MRRNTLAGLIVLLAATPFFAAANIDRPAQKCKDAANQTRASEDHDGNLEVLGVDLGAHRA